MHPRAPLPPGPLGPWAPLGRQEASRMDKTSKRIRKESVTNFKRHVSSLTFKRGALERLTTRYGKTLQDTFYFRLCGVKASRALILHFPQGHPGEREKTYLIV